MAFEKKNYEFKILLLVLIGIPLIASTNIDCVGKSFHCVNSTHFMICVDLGGGVSSTVDDLVIPCPPSTLCLGTNRFECEFLITTTPTSRPQVTEVTNEISATPQWEEITVNTKFPKNVSEDRLDMKYVDGTNSTSTAIVTTDLPFRTTPLLNTQNGMENNNVVTTESVNKSSVTEAMSLNSTNETINNLANNQTKLNSTDIVVAAGPLIVVTNTTTIVSGTIYNLNASETNSTLRGNHTKLNNIQIEIPADFITIDKNTTVISEISDNPNAVNTVNNTENYVTLNPINETVMVIKSIGNSTAKIFTPPLIFDGVQVTEPIINVSENFTEFVNTREPVNTSEKNIVTKEILIDTTSYSTSNNLTNNRGTISVSNAVIETNDTDNNKTINSQTQTKDAVTLPVSVTTVSTNIPEINDAKDPPTTEGIMTNTEKLSNGTNNILEITADSGSKVINESSTLKNTSHKLDSDVVSTAAISIDNINASETNSISRGNQTKLNNTQTEIDAEFTTIDTNTTVIFETTDNPEAVRNVVNTVNNTENYVTFNSINETAMVIKLIENSTTMTQVIISTTSIPDLVTDLAVNTIDDKTTQAEIFTSPLIFDGVQTVTESITYVSENFTEFVNTSEPVNNKMGPMNENGTENIVTTEILIDATSYSTSNNLTNNRGTVSVSNAVIETNDADNNKIINSQTQTKEAVTVPVSITTVSTNIPEINDAKDPPTTEGIMINTDKFSNGTNNILEITADSASKVINESSTLNNTSHKLDSDVVSTAAISIDNLNASETNNVIRGNHTKLNNTQSEIAAELTTIDTNTTVIFQTTDNLKAVRNVVNTVNNTENYVTLNPINETAMGIKSTENSTTMTQVITSIPDLVTDLAVNTIDEKTTQAEIFTTPLIFDGVQTVTETIMYVSENFTEFVNTSEPVNIKMDLMNESGIENIVTTTTEILIDSISYSTSSNLTNNRGAVSVSNAVDETNDTDKNKTINSQTQTKDAVTVPISVNTVFTNIPEINDAKDPPTTEVITTNIGTFSNGTKNILEITADYASKIINESSTMNNTNHKLDSDVVSTAAISTTPAHDLINEIPTKKTGVPMPGTEKVLPIIVQTTVQEHFLTTTTGKMMNSEIVTLNPITKGFISNAPETSTPSGLPNSEIEATLVSTTTLADSERNESFVNSKPQSLHLNEAVTMNSIPITNKNIITTENTLFQTGNNAIPHAITSTGNVENNNTVQDNLTDNVNVSQVMSTSDYVVTSTVRSNSANSIDEVLTITTLLPNDQNMTFLEDSAAMVTATPATFNISLKENQPVAPAQEENSQRDKTQIPEIVQQGILNKEKTTISWRTSTMVETSTSATTMSDIYFRKTVPIEEITTISNTNVDQSTINILSFAKKEHFTAKTTNLEIIVPHTSTSVIKKVNSALNSNVDERNPNPTLNQVSNLPLQVEGSATEYTKVNTTSLLQFSGNNTVHNLTQSTSHIMLTESSSTTAAPYETLNKSNQSNDITVYATTSQIISPSNALEISSTLKTIKVKNFSESTVETDVLNSINRTDFTTASTTTPVETEEQKEVTMQFGKTKHNVNITLPNELINNENTSEIQVKDTSLQTEKRVTDINNTFVTTTMESFIDDNYNVTIQDTMIVLSVTSEGLTSFVSEDTSKNRSTQLIKGILTEPDAKTGTSLTISPQGLLNSHAQIGNLSANDTQNSKTNNQAHEEILSKNDSQQGLLNSQAQKEYSSTNSLQSGSANSQTQAQTLPYNGLQQGSLNRQVQAEISTINSLQQGLLNSGAQTGTLSANDSQNATMSQTQAEILSTNDPQNGLESSQAKTGNSSKNDSQHGSLNSQAKTENSSPNSPQNGSVNSQTKTGTLSMLDPQGSLNSLAQTGTSLTSSPQGFLNSHAQTENSSAIDSQNSKIDNQAQEEILSTNDSQQGLFNSQAQTDNSSANSLQNGSANSQTQAEPSPLNGLQQGSLNSRVQAETATISSLQQGLLNSGAQIGTLSANDSQNATMSQAQAEIASTNDLQNALENRQARTGTSSTNDTQQGSLNSQAKMVNSSPKSPQNGSVNSQTQTGTLSMHDPQGSPNSLAQTGTSLTSSPQGLLNTHAQTGNSSANDAQNSKIDNQAHEEILSTSDSQQGLFNSQAQTENSSANDSQNSKTNNQAEDEILSTNDSQQGLLNSQALTETSLLNGLQQGSLNSQVQAETATINSLQQGLLNSGAQTGILSANDSQNATMSQAHIEIFTTNDLQSGLESSQAKTGTSSTNDSQHGSINSQAQPENSSTNSPQNGSVNSQTQTGTLSMHDPQGSLNSLAQTGTSLTSSPQGLLNSHAQTGNSSANDAQNSKIDNQAHEEILSTSDSQQGLFNSHAQTENSSANSLQSDLANSQTQAETSPLNVLQQGSLNSQVQVETSTINSLQQGLLNSQVQAENATINSLQQGSLNSGAQTGTLSANDSQKATMSQAQTEILSTNDPQNGLENSQAKAGTSSTKNDTQQGSLNNLVQAGASSMSDLQEGSLDNQTHEETLSRNGSQQGSLNNQASTETLSPNIRQLDLLNSQTTAETSSTNRKQNSSVNSHAQVGNSSTNENYSQQDLLKIPAETKTSSTNGPQQGTLNSQARTGILSVNNPLNSSGNSQAQTESSSLNSKQNELTNSQIPTAVVQPENIPGSVSQQETYSQNVGKTSDISTLHLTEETTTKRQVTLQTEITTSEPVEKTSINPNNLIEILRTTKSLPTSTSSFVQPSTTTVKPTTKIDTMNGNQKVVTNKPNFTCKHHIRGRYSDTDNCRIFYTCSGKQEPIIGLCPVNTVFSEIWMQCTKNLSHCIRNNQFKCVSEGRFSDNLQQSVYYICVRNRMNQFVRFKFQCQKGYFLNKTNVRCLKIPEVINVSTSVDNISKSTVEKKSTEEKKSKEESESKKRDEFECEKEGKFADENNCRRYYICTKTNRSEEFRRRKKNCDSDEVFHKDKKKCVDAESYEC